MNESTRFISPTKTPEYLAAGKTVVSTPIADVLKAYGVNNLVQIAASAATFVEAIEKAMANRKNPEWKKAVDANLASNSLSDAFPILIINDSSVLSTYLIECCRSRSLHYLVVSDPSDLIKTREVVEKHRPWVIVNTTIYKHDNVNNTEHIPDLLNLVEICLETNIHLLAFISGKDALYNSPTGLEKHISNLLPNAMIWKSGSSLEEGALNYEITNRCIDLLIDIVSLSY